MKKFFRMMASAVLALAAISCGNDFETVKGDPMGAQIYTLKNGLKVYMSVNKEEPRIQTYIAVRSGGKNDPSDNTGLAHYLEHIMFKGTELCGTSDYEAEKPLLDSIQALYDIYRTKTDDAERAAIYHIIDSLSYEASKISIPNEYDKAMSIIGSRGSNAYTSNDVTCYQEDIPANQIENWAKVQADRFKNLVVRGFHTELEAVYEEFNMGLTDDSDKAMQAVDSVLFRNHPYGTQTVIGTQAHLKNPSISAIKKQKALMYVPNNCAICVSGDFDPEEMVAIIEKYFGDWEPNPSVPLLKYEEEKPLDAPVEKTVYGQDSEFVLIAWRYPAAATPDAEVASIVGSVLNNGMAGLIDLDINQQQKALGVSAQTYGRSDYGEMMFEGQPKDGQTLEEVKELILAEVEKLRSGDFDEDLVAAAVSNWKLSQMRRLERNSSRASAFVNSFVNGTKWEDEVTRPQRIGAITKADVVAWANKYLAADQYALCYKRMGNAGAVQKVSAPAITPIVTNRDKQSAFLTEIQNSQVKPIEPVFADYSKDLSVFNGKSGVEVIYKQNSQNDIASVSFVYNTGIVNDPALDLATDYIQYLGTPTRSAEQIAKEMYKLACSFSIRAGSEQTTVSVSGLSENLGAALDIVEDLIANAQADDEILAELKADLFKSRAMAKLAQRSCASALLSYAQYGLDYVKATTLSNAALVSAESSELLSKVAALINKNHQVQYYGPASQPEFTALLEEHHNIPAELENLTRTRVLPLTTSESQVIVAPYNSRQFTYTQFSNRGEHYVLEDAPAIRLFNEYFGGGMNTIVFQEMREARALAYSAGATLATPSFKDGNYTFSARIGSQNDKLRDAVEAFDLIINDMPESDKAYTISKTALEGVLRTQRTTGRSVISSFLSARELGLNEPVEKYIYEHLSDLDMKALSDVQKKWVKDRTYTYSILGDPSDLDMNFLKTLGPVKVVSLEEIFGY